MNSHFMEMEFWRWNIFKDKNPVHTYNKTGKYTVTLTTGNTKDSSTKTVAG